MELDLWTQSLVTAMTALWTKVANFIPNLFGALVLVLLGFVVAKLLDTLLSKLLAKLGLDRLMAGTGLTKLLGRAGFASADFYAGRQDRLLVRSTYFSGFCGSVPWT
ncbi:hypothetical protein QF045_004599 [Pseudomonas sp. W4I3]|nr:hypothetical protein [Pseudomonas sp. W4I3]